MNKKTLLITLGAALIVGGLGVGLYDSQQGSQQLQSSLILPDLASVAATIDHIKLESAGGRLLVESHKDGEQWLIDNLGNYAADTVPLSELINNLKDARKVEAKTAKPELFYHLGLTDVSSEQSKALLVTVSGSGKEYQLLVGDSAKNGSGQYVRVAGSNQTYLVDKSFNKPDKAEDWVNTKLFDFELGDIAEVSLDGTEQYSLSKSDKEQKNFTLAPLPATHELKYDSITDALPRALSNLRFEALKPAAEYSAPEALQKLTVKLFESADEVELKLAQVDDKYYVQLRGSNPLWNDWVYELSQYNYNQLVKAKTDYLNEIKATEPQDNSSQPANDTP